MPVRPQADEIAGRVHRAQEGLLRALPLRGLTRLPNMDYAPAMGAEETELEMVRRHVREGEEHLASQRAVIERLKASNLPPEEAEALLDTFEELQRQHEAHLVHVEGKRE